jgi:hypothetical protein
VRLPGITYDSNLSFSRPERVRLAVLPPLAAGLMRLLLSSCRMDIREKGNVDQVVALHGHALIALWHESMLAACWISRNRNYHTLTSHSFDGEFAARVLNRFGIEAVRGSSSRGGVKVFARWSWPHGRLNGLASPATDRAAPDVSRSPASAFWRLGHNCPSFPWSSFQYDPHG